MSDIVKIVFDGDLSPLQQKQAAAKAQLNTFVAESEAKMKGIAGPGDPVGGVGPGGLKAASSVAATGALTAEATAETVLAGATQAATVAATEQTVANVGVASSAGVATGALSAEAGAAEVLTGALAGATSAQLAFFAVLGSVAAVGAAAYLVTKQLNKEADLTLSLQEATESAINRQILGLKESLSDYTKIKEELVQQEALQRKIAGYLSENDTKGAQALKDRIDQDNVSRVKEINRLQAELATNEKQLAIEKAKAPANTFLQLFGGVTAAEQRQNVGFAEANINRTKKRLEAEEEALKQGTKNLQELDGVQADITAKQDSRFASSFDNFVAAQNQRRKLAEEAAEKFAESVKRGEEEAKKSTSDYKDAFQDLFKDAYRENPFATRVLESASALETLEEKLRGVGPELRKQAGDLFKATAAQEAYALQINTAFANIDLRAQAGKFRNLTQNELQKMLNSRVLDFNRESNSTNPDAIEDFRSRQRRIDNFESDRQKEVLNQKLDLASRARTDAERAIADKAVTAAAGGINPDDLSQSERNKIADAFDRSAARSEARQEESLSVQKNILATMKNIERRGALLNSVAATGGLEAVLDAIRADAKEGTFVDLKVTDETNGAVEIRTRTARPKPSDTNSLYPVNPFGIVNGSNR